MRGIVLSCLVGCAWFLLFVSLSRSSAPPPTKPETEETKRVKASFRGLAATVRKRLELNPLFGSQPTPGMVTAILEFTASSAPPPRTLAVDGFTVQHVDVYRGERGVDVLAVMVRPRPYEWARSIEVNLGPQYWEKADLEQATTSDAIGFYRIPSDAQCDIHSPGGNFTWSLTKDKVLLTSPSCLFREDLYRDGEWLKSLVAVRK